MKFAPIISNQFSMLGNGVEVVSGRKVVKLVKDPAIKEGFPLPDTGTCKHYKKSYRWLRYSTYFVPRPMSYHLKNVFLT